ncbi:MAG: alpha/beta fold hydrolase [Candidatus Rokubacteria bacterium]|nr:alpha/beta fold hydrolase [Candidatus Rokubacteria bacterium]
MNGAFRPPWWCRSAHLQTIWGPLFRRGRLAVRRERVATRDGDFVDLDWAEGGAPGAPLLLVLHGLEGSSQSHYAVGLMHGAAGRGWRAATLNFRSCSGELNRRDQFYHSGHTEDLDDVVRLLLGREPGLALGVVGVSLGGNVLVKWLGERADGAPAAVFGAVAISTPFRLTPCAESLDEGFNRAVYTANFLKSMRAKVRDKARRSPGFAVRVDVPRALRARTFREYDRAVTAPLNGFADERDYWTRASSAPYLARVRRPTLLIHALDDPMVPAASLPDPAALPPAVHAEFVPRGGHAGFIDGRWPWRAGSWAERRAVEFLAGVLAGAGGGARGARAIG